MNGKLSIRGARQHNLKNISLDIPKQSLTVITGLSGSGKSSLAFDTIYAEGQRRYVESLSAYARQFLNLASKPDVDHIDGLSPAIAIDQKTTSRNPRSTVGTITEIYDYLRLLYANVGTAYCPNHPDVVIEAQTISQMVDQILSWPEGTRLQLLAPVVRGRKGEYRKELKEWQSQGLTRVRLNGEVVELADVPALDKQKKHDIDLVVDRLVARPENQQRLADSLETAIKLTGGMAIAEPVAKVGDKTKLPAALTFNANRSCPICSTSYELEPRLFSFNSPYGACKTCDGLGEMAFVDPALVVPNPTLSIRKGAIASWGQTGVEYYGTAIAKHYGFDLNLPFNKLPEHIQNVILYGSGDEEIPFVFKGGKANFKTTKTFEGVVPNLERRFAEAKSPYDREDLNKFRSSKPCESCGGDRLNPNTLSVRIKGLTIADVTKLPINEALTWADRLGDQLSGNRAKIAQPILREITARLGFLNHVGLDYLSLARQSSTLSGGESQRIRLASQIGSGLTGVLYVLDEPSIGLHQRDNTKLLETLKKLRDLDNTILVVEHDEDAIRTADHVVDIGPGAGELGGQVVAEGTVDDICAVTNSITGQYLTGERAIRVPAKRRIPNANRQLTIHKASGNNLKNISASFPLGLMTCVTGVSGSGKSTLVMDTLHRALSRQLGGSERVMPAPFDKITGTDAIDKIVNIDQSPIGRTPRSNPATYSGLMTPLREWYAQQPESQARGYTPGRFSFNVKGGRCEACQGDGLVKIEMHFLADVYVPCDVCEGKRYNRETLDVTYKGKNIADALAMTVGEAHEFFANVPKIKDKLQTLMDVGLSYIRLGQSATTLSGGEAQRIKLAKELTKRATGKTFYILDEPTTGLHFADIDQLLKVLHRLVDDGNTMVIIEHNLDVIKTADWLIDIGPEGGAKGGKILATGTPEDIAKVKESYTGQFLAPLLKKKDKAA